MISVDKNSLAKRFGNSSNKYEDATPVQEKMAQSLIDKLLHRLEDRKILSILEIGCGSARMTRRLVDAFPLAKITAIDIADEMISIAKNNCPQAEYVVADAEKYLPLLDKKFDLVISSATIQWFENPDATLGKAYELLNPSGHLAMATFCDRTFHELSSSFENAYQTNKIEPRSHVVPMRSVRQWLKIVPKAEISDEIDQKTFCDVRTFLRSIQDAGAVNSLASRFAIPKKVLQSMKDYYCANYSCEASGAIVATYHICYIFQQKSSHAF